VDAQRECVRVTTYVHPQVACHFRSMWVLHTVMVQWQEQAQAARAHRQWENAQAEAALQEAQVRKGHAQRGHVLQGMRGWACIACAQLCSELLHTCL